MKDQVIVMKHIIIIFLCLLFFSCEDDFLERSLQGELELTNFMQNETDVVLSANAAYNVMRDWRYMGGFPFIDILTDDVTKGSNPTDGSHLISIENFTFLPTSLHVSGLYLTQYQAIRRANLVIEKAGEVEMDNALRNRLIAECKFIRAISYFHLVRAYGGVPLVETINPERLIPRNTADEIYDFVISDLLSAVESLPERSDYSSADLGRVTKGAAKTLLSKVYLYRSDFSNAEKYALEVINSGQYSLDPDFGNTFSVNGEFGPGSIFELGAVAENKDNGGNQFANTQAIRGTPNRGWGFGRPSWDLITFFDGRDDPRLDASVIFLNEVLDGVTIIGDINTPDTTYDANGNVTEVECYSQKVWTPGTTTQDSWAYNLRFLRYADVLLIAAEALNENGKPSEALTYLNMVRERARGTNSSVLPDVTETNQELLQQIIYDERRAEMALEQNRFFDVVRTGRGTEVFGPLGFQAGKHELLPIPQSEIDLSEGTLVQNPGY